jgi:hypothetical protein
MASGLRYYGEPSRFQITASASLSKIYRQQSTGGIMTRFSAAARIGAILVFVVVLSAGVAFGQQVTGTILGRITDGTGSVVSGATIQILNIDTGFSRTEQADSDGRYLSSNLPLGSYSVTVQKQGFKTSVRSGVVLTVGS